MTVARSLLAVLALLTLAGCGQSRPVAQITMRNGAVLTVLQPQAFYVAVCDQGTYRRDGDPDADADGLRTLRKGVNPTKWGNDGQGQYDEIKWADIDSIVFGRGFGDALGYCSGMPLNVAATIHFKDGHVEQRVLADTTDRGIEGSGEHGGVMAPIRNIARLQMVADGGWDWEKVQTGDLPAATLHIALRDGKAVTANDMTVIVPLDRYSRLGVTQPSVYGLPVLTGGARLEIAWAFIASATLSGDAKLLRADIVYGDGRRETVTVADGELSGMTAGESGSLANLHDIAKITVTTDKPKP